MGLLFATVPAGAALGAALSGWAAETRRPAAAMVGLSLAALGAVACLGAAGGLAPALAALVAYGYAVSLAGLLQYALLQRATPDRQLGRVNALWVAQESLGEIAGVILVGPALVAYGLGLALLAGLLALLLLASGAEAASAAEGDAS